MQTRLSPVLVEGREPSVAELEEQIRHRAYEVYEARGRGDGHALDDWLEAKAEILGVVRDPERERRRAAR